MFQKHLSRLLLVILTFVIMIAAALFAAPQLPPLRDFDQTFYPAIRYTLAGENPYMAYYEETDQGAPPNFFSPPWLLLILLPFGLFPMAVARSFWLLFLIGVTLYTIGLLRPWGLHGLKPLLLVALPWSLIGLLFGQVAVLVLLGAVLAIVEARKPDRTHAGALKLLLGLLLMGIKPQLGLILALPLLIQMAWQRDRRLPLVVGLGAVILMITLLLIPSFWAHAAQVGQIAPHWTSTLERELALWQWPAWPAHLVRLLVVGGMLLWAWRDRSLSPGWWSAWLAAVLIITPYTRAYDGVLLLPLLGQMIFHHRWAALLFVLVMVLYVQLPFGELGSVVAPLAAWSLSMVCHLAKRGRYVAMLSKPGL
jgi:hypothetical protein